MFLKCIAVSQLLVVSTLSPIALDARVVRRRAKRQRHRRLRRAGRAVPLAARAMAVPEWLLPPPPLRPSRGSPPQDLDLLNTRSCNATTHSHQTTWVCIVYLIS